MKALHAKIGELTLEYDLSGALTKAGLLAQSDDRPDRSGQPVVERLLRSVKYEVRGPAPGSLQRCFVAWVAAFAGTDAPRVKQKLTASAYDSACNHQRGLPCVMPGRLPATR
jgi:hypothetical protein